MLFDAPAKVNAVFVQSTMKVAQADEEFILLEKKKTETAYRRKVTSLFRQVDTSGDGKIDAHEFKRLLKAGMCWDSLAFDHMDESTG